MAKDRRDTSTLRLTGHARSRCQQRGVPLARLSEFLRFADAEVKLPGGCTSLMLSNDMQAELIEQGVSPDLAARLGRRAAVLAPNGDVLTILVPNRRRGRGYRRGVSGRPHAFRGRG